MALLYILLLVPSQSSPELAMYKSTPAAFMAVCATFSISLLQTKTSHASDMVEFATGGYARGVQTETMMHKIDTNHDGKITKEEWLAYQEKVWKALDKDAHGVVNEQEFLAPSATMASFATGGYARGLQTPEMMRKIDKDGDGTVSHEEFIADQTALFDLMDTGHSGAVGPREFLDRKFSDAR
jgi:Ca2+-binding EF-hand superfamily protein